MSYSNHTTYYETIKIYLLFELVFFVLWGILFELACVHVIPAFSYIDSYAMGFFIYS